VSSVRDNRQRAAARARLEREMAARQEAARRKRLLQARIGGGIAGVIVLGAVIWIVVATAGGGSSQPAAGPSGPAGCVWFSDLPTPDPTASPGASPSLPAGIKDVGMPPTEVPHSGFQVLTFDTNQGVIEVEMDLSKTPCTGASMAFLANKGFYNNSSCHRLVDQIFALQCGDPSGTGTGGATYRFANENLPTGKLPTYHAGDVAMANTGQPDSNGTQFFFVYENSQLPADYSLWGHVIKGFDVVQKVAAGGDDGAFSQDSGGAGGGHPKIPLSFKSVTAGPVTTTSQVQPTTPPPATTPASAPTAAPTATP
jgi:peptidyl-prolyl cis-trans isomerase B (cyclophilin B)